MSGYNKKYFAADEAEKAVECLQQKGNSWYSELYKNNYLLKLKRSWLMYHGASNNSGGGGHEVTFGGESGELANLSVNNYRNIADHIITLVTSTRPSFQTRSTNTDYKSQVQTGLANGLLDYYMREKRLEQYLKRAVTYGVVLGSGYIKLEWNATSGKIYDHTEPDEASIVGYNAEGEPVDKDGKVLRSYPIYEGDVQFSNLSPFDVVFDTTKEDSSQHDWVLVRTFKNKFDLAAKYPELEDKILATRTKSENNRARMSISPLDETVDVPVYEFFHKRTESMPDGRYLLYLDSDCILMDTVMPYRKLPVYRLSPSEILGTPYGYTQMFDLLPIQTALDSLYSTVLTNQSAFGVQNVLNPRGNDIRVNQVSGGLNFIEYNPLVQGSMSGKPEALNLTNTPEEIFGFMKILEGAMEKISAINSVVRGDPEASLKSGTALALVQSQALQFVSGLQQSYIMMIEDVGTGLIQLLQDFASVPRVAEITGLSNKSKMKEFTSSDIDTISRVNVDVGNSLAQCLAKDTEVLMFDGSVKKVQDIIVGDQVMGPDSKARTVNNVNSGQEEMFSISAIEQNRNVDFVCNKSHILTLRYCSNDSRYNAKKGDIIDISVNDYLKLSHRQRRLLQGVTTGVDFKEQAISIPAYIIGSWIGDGTSASTAITTMDSEIESEWRNYASSIGMSLRKQEQAGNKSSVFFVTSGQKHGSSERNPMMGLMREMDLIDNKHIPNNYLINSEKNRLELLAGLIDTDGSIVDKSTFVFTQKSERIIDQVKFLASSLGFRTTKKLVKRIFNDKPADIFKLSIGGDTYKIPTRLARKQAIKRSLIRNVNNYGIKVVSQGQGTYYGFTLAEEPHFVLGNFVVTHNTTAGRVQMADNLIQMGLVKTPEQYFSVINTGKLEVITEGIQSQLLLIKAENERLTSGEAPVVATPIDSHSMHIKEHMNVLADPDLRFDPALRARVVNHIQEHISALQTTDPNLLALIGEQPLAPPGGTPVATGTVAPGQPPQNSMGGPSELMSNPQSQTTQPSLNIPQPATAEGQVSTPQEMFAQNART